MLHGKLHFTACGLFNLDFSLVHTVKIILINIIMLIININKYIFQVTAALATYMVVMNQFDDMSYNSNNWCVP